MRGGRCTKIIRSGAPFAAFLPLTHLVLLGGSIDFTFNVTITPQPYLRPRNKLAANPTNCLRIKPILSSDEYHLVAMVRVNAFQKWLCESRKWI